MECIIANPLPEHCMDSLRQSLTCSADISTTTYWAWGTERQATVPDAGTTHLCRNFTRIPEWAREHRLGPTWDPFMRVEEGNEGRPLEGQGVGVL
jgi:hypothetical protein